MYVTCRGTVGLYLASPTVNGATPHYVGERRDEWRSGRPDGVCCLKGFHGQQEVDGDVQGQGADHGHAQPERQGHGVRRPWTDRRQSGRDRERASASLSAVL